MRFLAWGRYVGCDTEGEVSELLGKGRKECATPEPRRSGDPVNRWKVRVDCEGPEHRLNEGHRKVTRIGWNKHLENQS